MDYAEFKRRRFSRRLSNLRIVCASLLAVNFLFAADRFTRAFSNAYSDSILATDDRADAAPNQLQAVARDRDDVIVVRDLAEWSTNR